MLEEPNQERADWAAYASRWKCFQLSEKLRTAEMRARQSEARLAGMEGSRSWRSSRPLRAFDNLVGHVARRLRKPASPAKALDWGATHDPVAGGGVIAVDVSRTWRGETSPGMRRVVRGFVESLPQGAAVRPVDLRRGAIHDLSGHGNLPDPVDLPKLREISKLFLMDAAWDVSGQVAGLSRVCSARGIEVIGCLHDLIPLERADLCIPEVPKAFKEWLDMAVAHFDCMACVSQTTALKLREWIARGSWKEWRLKRIGWWLPGFSMKVSPNDENRLTACPSSPFALMVGTLEPRKNHAFVLDEFSKWWSAGHFNGTLVLVGSPGWGMDGFVELLTSHPEFGRRLWWFPDASDAELCHLYRECRLVLMPSIAEGLGLPLIEAEAYGKSLVLSDLPVFRELVVSGGFFFSLGDREGFRSAVDQAWSCVLTAAALRVPTAGAGAESLYWMIRENTWQLRIED